jgi:hypothetical protein
MRIVRFEAEPGGRAREHEPNGSRIERVVLRLATLLGTRRLGPLGERHGRAHGGRDVCVQGAPTHILKVRIGHRHRTRRGALEKEPLR